MPDLNRVLPTAYAVLGDGILKQSPADFVVRETLSFPFSGEGEHAYLRIEKTGQNTAWVCRILARHFGLKERDIGYAGLKDRHAVTTQWFSLPEKFVTQERLDSFGEEDIIILEHQRHSGKLRKGAVRHNEFEMVLRDVHVDAQALDHRIQEIATRGVPNYFDEQRFGRQRRNLVSAQDMFAGKFSPKRHKRGIYLSAARSWLFNLVLAERVGNQTWNQPIDGDVFSLEGSKSCFLADIVDAEIRQRVEVLDIHPSGPLWGQGELMSRGPVRQLEERVVSDWQDWCRGLEEAGLKQQRRALRVVPIALTHQYDVQQKTLWLSFALPAGAYATNLVREITATRQNAEKTPSDNSGDLH